MKPIKVYVAGASKERHERAVPIINALLKKGIVITYDWTLDMKDFGPEYSDEYLTAKQRIQYARADLDAVLRADYILFLTPENGSAGAWVEYGYAIASDIPVIVTGKWHKSIFTSMAYKLFEIDMEAVDYLDDLNSLKLLWKV